MLLVSLGEPKYEWLKIGGCCLDYEAKVGMSRYSCSWPYVRITNKVRNMLYCISYLVQLNIVGLVNVNN